MKNLFPVLALLLLSACATPTSNYGIDDGILDYYQEHGRQKQKKAWFTGQATKIYNNGDKYVGEFREGLRHGKGVFVSKNGVTYEGDFKKNMRNGRGAREYKKDLFTANFINDKLAKGPCHSTNLVTGLKWMEGECTGGNNGEILFIGKKRYHNGTVYIGDFKNWTPHGKGKLLNSDGEVLKEGIWENEIFDYSPKDTCRDYGFKDDTDGMGLCLIELNKLAELERQTEILKNSSNNQAMLNNANAAIYAKELADRKRQREAQALMNLGAIIGGTGSSNTTNNKTKGSSSAIKWEDNYSSTLNVPSNQVCPITGSPLVKQERRGINKICYYQ